MATKFPILLNQPQDKTKSNPKRSSNDESIRTSP
ncbi:uncharacterized protein G2W53_032197 [Senna tora]|uniref:Uncharacterized protein n=1 Tax=Senna tora TaxID=362788 RepID=A0A834WA25_9FABA|nr:uncharacterized protein G2W53_032197 [Senna tora]